MTIRLAELIEEFQVPGASTAYWHDGEIHRQAGGLLNRDTGVEATPGSLFQIGSVTKVWTTAMIMLLIEQGRLTLGTPVSEVLPEIDPSVTIEHLLTHTSGLDGDFFHDTGRGDDCLEKYVTAIAARPLAHPAGATHSYSNGGFSVAGRVVEVITGKVWDTALRDQLVTPLGLTGTWTLPEDVLRFRAATGHLGDANDPTPTWGIMRSNSPAGQICATAADLVRFGRTFAAGGGPLSEESVRAMAKPRVEVPARVYGTHWGLGWILDTWDGTPVLLHGGNTIGQAAMLWVVPSTGTVIALLANGGDTDGFFHAVAADLFPRLAGLRPPSPPQPPDPPSEHDLAAHEGVYERTGARITVRTAELIYENTSDLADLQPPMSFDLVPTGEHRFLARRPGDRLWTPGAFYSLRDGSPHLYFGVRSTPKTS
ncbi:serine hydrolase domain-containing protein [Nonomuraea zeae]|uniref:Beta-lactamase family protein n=1 Tax=Nonomuraea zeae TaxID=1642303 RepID=A0A5S4H4J0_9ACTN|nr:serine hydrolase domain-containing protein [Nonomuraea zeae]TMR39664.1 beta-lactamase family protein [Nonomuraea zeae]